jgi:polynucleotide 5'-kinase involved in rRNA processing
VVVLQRGREAERLAALVETSTSARVARVQSVPEARRRSPVYRRTQRVNRMHRHLAGAREWELDAGRVVVFDAWLYSGEALPADRLAAAAEALRTRIPHGEVTADGVYLCAESRPDRSGFVTLAEEFGRRRVTVTPVTAFRGLLIGLVGAGGHLVDIGLLQAVHFERAALTVLSPARSVTEVRQVHVGRLRLRPDGSQIARLRPGDL